MITESARYYASRHPIVLLQKLTGRLEGVWEKECHLLICANRSMCFYCKMDKSKASEELVANKAL